MTPENFCFWLNGYVELDGRLPTLEQWRSIKEHLNLVFDKVTPDVEYKEPTPYILETIHHTLKDKLPTIEC